MVKGTAPASFTVSTNVPHFANNLDKNTKTQTPAAVVSVSADVQTYGVAVAVRQAFLLVAGGEAGTSPPANQVRRAALLLHGHSDVAAKYRRFHPHQHWADRLGK